MQKKVQNKHKTRTAAARKKRVVRNVRMHTVFSGLSLTSKEEHELLQNLFVSVFKRGMRKQGNRNNHPLEHHIVVQSNNSEEAHASLIKGEKKVARALGANVGEENSTNKGSKYKNVESIIKYVETPDDNSAVKLVIMNFND